MIEKCWANEKQMLSKGEEPYGSTRLRIQMAPLNFRTFLGLGKWEKIAEQINWYVIKIRGQPLWGWKIKNVEIVVHFGVWANKKRMLSKWAKLAEQSRGALWLHKVEEPYGFSKLQKFFWAKQMRKNCWAKYLLTFLSIGFKVSWAILWKTGKMKRILRKWKKCWAKYPELYKKCFSMYFFIKIVFPHWGAIWLH